ncbi:MAG: VWA domain-containing protein [Pseudohongiellaceae bacterium]
MTKKDSPDSEPRSPVGVDRGQLSVSSRNEIAAFLKSASNLPVRPHDARLIFALDATASRQPTWDIATELQAEMFGTANALGGLSLQLCYFRGLGEFFASDWHEKSDSLLQLMAGIQCQAGATQLEKLFRHALRENGAQRLKGIVFIGDSAEENVDVLAQVAGKLGMLNVPLFLFQERGDPKTTAVFKELCRLSGGAYSQFDAASAAQLKELLQAVAAYAAGGLKALRQFSAGASGEVRLLEQQLRA